MEEILKKAYGYGTFYFDYGKVADYIPELAKENKYRAGAVIIDKGGEIHEIGDCDYRFTMQSIIKVILYLCVLENYDLEYVKTFVGVKPSAKPFNSIIELELSDKNIPVNPFINAGAIVTTDLLYKKYGEDTFNYILNKAKLLLGNNNLTYSKEIFESEKKSAYANKALTYMMVGSGIIPGDTNIENMLDVYFKSCSILVNVKELARLSFILSRRGKDLDGNELVLDYYTRIIRTIMATCGTYDYSGDFAVRIGLPAKSGVGGGIITASQAGYGIATYSPGLDSHGNSYVGTRMLEFISTEMNLNIY